MKNLIRLIIICGVCFSASCKKEKIRTSWADGVVIDTESGDTIPYAKVFLMGNDNTINVVDFSGWYPMDSLITDETGTFHFDFVIKEDLTRLGLYVQKEHYFEYKEVSHYDSYALQDGVRVSKFPKSYLKIRIKDEPPFSGYTSMHVPTLLTQDALQITGNPIDTTVVMWLHGGEALLVDWFYHDTDTTWVHDGGGYVSCPSFDTCYYQIIF